MTPTEAARLCERAQSGDTDARDKLVLAYRPLVWALAWEWRNSVRTVNHLDVDDLAADGLLYLLEHVVPEFDPTRGVYFGTYARRRVRERMLRHQRRETRRAIASDALPDYLEATERRRGTQHDGGDLERLVRRLEGSGRITGTQATLLRLRGRGLTWQEVADAMGLTRGGCKNAYTAARRTIRGTA